MANGKKSFIAYTDWKPTFDLLSDEEAGQLIKFIFSYVHDENPETDNRIIQLSFSQIQQDLKRDLKKWEKYIDKQKTNGKKGGRPKTQKTQAFFEKPKKADNVNVNVNVNDNVIVVPTINEFIDYAIEKKPNASTEDLKLKYNSWVENGWKDGNDNKIKNWKTKLLNTLPYIKEQTKKTSWA